MAKMDPKLVDILKQYHDDPKSAVWDCHGTWVIYHKACEEIAVKAGIKFDPPTFQVTEPRAAVMTVVGYLGDQMEWSVGEAVIDLNYRVSGKQAGYPFAMAEKRAKDRVILKLIGLHGLAYSEEEADDFKQSAKQEPPITKVEKTRPTVNESIKAKGMSIANALNAAQTAQEVIQVWNENIDDIDTLPPDYQQRLMDIRDRFKTEAA